MRVRRVVGAALVLAAAVITYIGTAALVDGVRGNTEDMDRTAALVIAIVLLAVAIALAVAGGALWRRSR